MNLDFIIFPATTQTSEHPDGQIIWIPKQAKLYPDFKGYIHRRIKKQQVFFQLESHISDDEDDNPHEMQQIPIFQWQPKGRSKMEEGKHNHIKQLDIIHSSNDNSPQIGSPIDPTGDYQSPDTLAQRLEKLNRQATNQHLQGVSDEDNVKLPNDPKSAQSASSYLSQQFIRMPRQMNQDVSSQQQSKFRPSSSNHSADTLGYIPCMYVGAHQSCPNILLYFHGNAENITLSYSFMVHLRNNFKISVIAVEYPGYGPYKNSSANENSILNDAEYVYNYLNMRLGYQQANIIVLGRSIGSGPATFLASKYKPGTLALVSPFTSLQAVVRDYIGGWASYLIKQRFDNLLNIQSVTSPIFILHGLVDELIPYKQSQQLKDVCKGYCVLHLAEEMDHINYKLNYDLIRPFSKFLSDINFFRRQEDVPKIPTGLFRDPFAE